MKETVVLYPTMGAGHVVPMIELAKLFVRHGVAVTMAVSESPHTPASTAQLISKVSATHPSISFHILPPVPPLANPHPKPFVNMFDILRLYNAHLLSFLRSLSETYSISALVIDFFCVDAIDVAAELGIPAYVFFSSGAADLALFLYLPTLLANTSGPLKDAGKALLSFPGVPPIPASHLPNETLDPDSQEYRVFLHVLVRIPETKGILVNSFESLEPRALKAMKDGLCLPARPTPGIYFVGPLVSGGTQKGEERHACLTWLDMQPKQSVVFLCFGSMGSFPVEQLKEIAFGLEKSGQRFLWVVRNPPNSESTMLIGPRTDPDLDTLLPEGFLDRTKERGMVLKSWAPQVEVLRHESVGGFVSHCGWNSTLEAVTAGVPVICWPLYAEQRLNKVFLVEEMKIGVELKGYDEEILPAEELAAKIKWVVESEGGKELRNRMAELKESAADALKEDGSSSLAFREFLASLKHG